MYTNTSCSTNCRQFTEEENRDRFRCVCVYFFLGCVQIESCFMIHPGLVVVFSS